MSDPAELGFEIPNALRQQMLDCAVQKQISLDWLVGLYRAGFNAKMGATGEHPFGRLGPDDEGELSLFAFSTSNWARWRAWPAGSANHATGLPNAIRTTPCRVSAVIAVRMRAAARDEGELPLFNLDED